jgi:hypothetical protein
MARSARTLSPYRGVDSSPNDRLAEKPLDKRPQVDHAIWSGQGIAGGATMAWMIPKDALLLIINHRIDCLRQDARMGQIAARQKIDVLEDLLVMIDFIQPISIGSVEPVNLAETIRITPA